MLTSLPLEIETVVPQPLVRRYVAMVVVKLPEFENIAIEPFTRDSSGLLPPSAPPILILFHASATPRQLPPNTSMPFVWHIARMTLASCTDTFSVRMIIFLKSGFCLTTSATPSLTPDGGR